jgi:CD36 family
MTIFDLDPWTGKLMNVRLMVQINLYLPPDKGYFNLYYRNVTKDIMMPFAIIREMARLNQADADEWHVLVADVLHDRAVGSICMLVIGVCLIALGIVLEVVRLRRLARLRSDDERLSTASTASAHKAPSSYSLQGVNSFFPSTESESDDDPASETDPLLYQ